MFKKVDPKMNFPKMEEEILKFWEENKIFKRSISQREGALLYSFYDGPPFATGTPHYGHIVASTMKDAVPRYWTMRGYQVERKWGWDCHGLPIENIAEKELGITHKKEIEEMGVEKFNGVCRSKVLEYVKEWETVIRRLGRWADMQNSYKTMDLSFMESVWWVFKELWDKGLIYEGYRSMHICPRCETTLSQSEVAEGYKDIKDLSAIAKFELVDDLTPSPSPSKGEGGKTFVLAWTTTPWTLIGNVALAVGKDITYTKAKVIKDGQEVGTFITSSKYTQDILPKLFQKEGEKISYSGEKIYGSDLVGKSYKPLFNYYSNNEKLENRENGWKIYPADFVTTEEGTGIVHIAPAFGEDDLNLGKKFNLPFVQHLGMDGIIKKDAGEFAGLSVKPKDDHQKTDVEIIKYLAKNNLLFAKEQYLHSYPHCWRCDTPLLNYTTSSWFVNVLKVKEEALKLAKNINWVPKHIKEGRFGNWLEGARDWSISRQRYWASVMPIWKCEKCQETKVIGSVDEISEQFGNPNKLFLVRHGEAENNIKDIYSSYPEKVEYPLTDKGRQDVERMAATLKKEKIDLIFSSPIIRTKETVEIIAKEIGEKVIFDERIVETGLGDINGKENVDWNDVIKLQQQENNHYNVETFIELKERMSGFLKDINEKYQGKNILIVSHGDPLRMLMGICQGLELEEIISGPYPRKGVFNLVYSKPIDLHKHTVDKISLKCEKCGGTIKRIPDVLDTWFDSGSMPYAQAHYPFENKEKFEKSFPAQFIAEGIDQTRCWFYYLHLISTAIKKSNCYKNVIVNGIVLAEDGKKMSKRLRNYPDPAEIFEKYGADPLRFYLLASPVVSAENLNFKESEVADLVRGMFRMLWNSYSFFVLYAEIDKFQPKNGDYKPEKTDNLLDKWIISELNVLIKDVNQGMEKYELNKTVRLFPEFVDNLSNWYIRRSRRRFWKSESDSDKKQAYETLYYVLVNLAKLLAPFCPFVAEEIYKNLTGEESVHLVDFPMSDEKLIDKKLNENMAKVRMIISEGLQKRAEAKVKVRQPLKAVTIKHKVEGEMLGIIKEELNVKEAIIDSKMDNEVLLDTEITEDLKLEGQAREVIRFVQEMRKEAGYDVENRIQVGYFGGLEIFKKFGEMIAKEVLADKLQEGELPGADLQKELKVDGENINLFIKRK